MPDLAAMEAWRFRQVANALNGSTLLGMGMARAGGARLTPLGRGLWFAEGYRWDFPDGSAFTVGNVVLTRYDAERLDEWIPRWRDHEEKHADQYAALAGLPFFPLYGLAAVYSWLRTSDWAAANVFEIDAGLDHGGYPEKPRTNEGLRHVGHAVKRTTAKLRPKRRRNRPSS